MTPVSFSMEILVIGTEEQAAECRQKFGGAHIVRTAARLDHAEAMLKSAGVIFDFTTEVDPGHVKKYLAIPETPLFFDATLAQLRDVTSKASVLRNPIPQKEKMK